MGKYPLIFAPGGQDTPANKGSPWKKNQKRKNSKI
jgi:hypothetical protein